MKVMLDEGAIMPTKAHEDDAGYDLFARKEFTIKGGEVAVVDTGVHVQIPKGCCGMLHSKSGLSIKRNIECCGGLIDCGYTGSIQVKLRNFGWEEYKFGKGEKITQLVILGMPIIDRLELVDHLDDTDRGNNGFGSSGR